MQDYIPNSYGYVAAVLIIAAVLYKVAVGAGNRKLLPPGPKRRWIVGNLFDLPRSVDVEVFASWQRTYGDIVYLEALGYSILVLNTAQAINDLLEKRGHIYSNRPRFVMAGELMGLDKSMALVQYGPEYKQLRKLTQHALSADSVRKYTPIQEKFVGQYMRSLLHNPDDFLEGLRFALGRTIIAITYGITVDDPTSEYIVEGELTMSMVGQTVRPGTWLVDLIPGLRHLPSWLPFQKYGRLGKAQIYRFVTRPFEYVKKQIETGCAPQSFVSESLADMKKLQLESSEYDLEDGLKWAAGTMYGAGVETTAAVVAVFFLLMAVHPEPQKKAQAEIDQVVGSDRMITLQDQPRLPYVRALIEEVMRWHVVVPLGIARRTAQDDEYKGFYIPAGTVVVPNVWAISQSEHSPASFRPERFLSPTPPESASEYVFGFGRRVCPGQYLAENSIFLIIANVLAQYNIATPSPEDAMKSAFPLPVDAAFTTALISFPQKFQCSIRPRSKDSIAVIENM